MVKPQVVIDTQVLKALRKAYNFSLLDMSAQLGYKTPMGYWNVENGERKVTLDTLYRLSKIFNCAMEDLVTACPEE